ncbi:MULTISPECIES: amino acid permease [Pseudomonas]|uniref:Amino acid permease-associated region n=1 Tax=Pseudomonas putida (strain W619) TaxID=390235 RepID=B1J8P7_PSEPW|nr:MULTISPECIES: amino acid permease [Pseudomonas]MDH1574256.1 amino acid permease [Pseudomonas sp. GD03746]QQE81632.1 amino acid permease [Pseudomonas putida]HEN8712467.1 amino acid permease [Pseudomonas putida]HEN8717691.1 amino acid permease [Pseudomonas putida]
MPIQSEHDPRLKRSLKTRHISMLALGGVIGAGLFVGSSAVITSTGPGAFLTYAITGIIVALVMRMLGEMAAAHPTKGSFVDYARMAFGRPAGYMTGWLYWYFWVIVVGFEAVVGGQIINGWFPDIPVWVIALGLMISMTLLNMMSVHSFGEAEYWFAGVKVAAIVVFLLVAGAYVFHLWPNSTASFDNLTQHGGFLPHGVGALFTGVVVVIFSMTGVEVATLAAAESEDPTRNIRKAVNTVMLRILVFFVLATFFIVVAQPWTSLTPGKSPFVTTLEHIGIPGAGEMLTAVILVAVLSVLNAGLYTSSRLLFVLASNDEAPRWIAGVNKKGVPVRGVLASTLVGYGCVVIAALWPDTVFQFLINSSGTVFLFVYLMICLSQLKLRRKWVEEGSLKFAMWAHPWLPLLVTASIIAVLVSMAFDPSMQMSLLQCVIAIFAIAASYLALSLSRKRQRAVKGQPVTTA